MDAITMLKDDHKAVEKLFKEFEKAGDRARVTKRRLVDQMIEALSRHTAIEEQAFYPATRATVADIDGLVLDNVEEHHVVSWLLHELEDLPVDDERFDAKTHVLIDQVRRHVEREEHDYFPKVRDEWSRNELRDLGDIMAGLKEQASPHPHPDVPNTPLGRSLVTGATATVDRIADVVSGIGQGSVDVVQDLVDRVRGVTPRRSSPTGPSSARAVAHKVRRSADDAVTATVDSVRAARDAGEDSVDVVQDAARDLADVSQRTSRRIG